MMICIKKEPPIRFSSLIETVILLSLIVCLISKSDLGYIDCNVTTVANNRVPIPGAPSTNRGYIPVIVGHDTTSSVLDNAFYDAGEWRIYSTFAQHAVVRFYKYPV